MSSAHYHVHFFSPSCSKVRAEPKVLDSRLGKHAFFPPSHSVSQPAGGSGVGHRYQTARTMGQETTTFSGDPRHDRQTTQPGWLLGAGCLSQRERGRGHESCPLRGPLEVPAPRDPDPLGLACHGRLRMVICRLLC